MQTSKSDQFLWGFWATLGFGLLVAAVWFLTQGFIAFILARQLDLEWQQIDYHGDVLSYATIASAITSVLIIFLIVWIRNGATLTQYLGFRRLSLRTLYIILAVTILFMAAQEGLSHVLGKDSIPEFMAEAYKTVSWLPLLWFAIAIAGPLVEEIFFRGFLLEGFRHSFMGNANAVFFTSLLWALIHVQYGWYENTIIFAMGILFGYARIITNSLWSPVIMHSVNNFTSTLFLHWQLTGQPVSA